MAGGDVAEDHRRTQCDAGTGIGSAHEAGRVVAGHVQALDGLTVYVKRPGVLVGPQTHETANIARYHLHSVEGPLLDGCHARVGRMAAAAIEAFVDVGSFIEFFVDAAFSTRIQPRHCLNKPSGIDATGLRQFIQRLPALEVAATNEGTDGQGPGRHTSQPVLPDGAAVTDDPTAHLSFVSAGVDHGRHEVVVRKRLADEAPSAPVHRDVASLAAVVVVRERHIGAIRLRHQRHRRPGRWVMLCVLDRNAGLTGQVQCVARVARGSSGAVVLARRDMSVVARAQFRAGRKAAASKHDAGTRSNFAKPFGRLHQRARDTSVLNQKLLHRRVQPQIDAALKSTERKHGHQCIAIGQSRAAPMPT